MRLLSDHEVYKLEMERIFAKTWLLLGHETEIPNSGDFVVRDMGEDQVIVSRDRKGDVHVLLNVCPHRGMRVCMAEVGNAPMHRCVYHGWAFRPDGSFIGAPIEREQMHGNIFAKEELGLEEGARAALRRPDLRDLEHRRPLARGLPRRFEVLLRSAVLPHGRRPGGARAAAEIHRAGQLEGRRGAVGVGRLPHAHAAPLTDGDRPVRARDGR